MEKKFTTKFSKKSRLIIFSAMGVVCLMSAYLILAYDPLELITQQKLAIVKGSFLFNLWEKPPLDVYVKVFLFNITNSLEFLSGKEKKLRLQEIGPYVYQEYLENKNAVFNPNGTLSFTPERTHRFVPEMSAGDPEKDIIIGINLPLLGASTVASEMSMFAAMALGGIASSYNSKSILNVTVQDYLWGYDDPIIRLASSVIPKIDFDQFGLLDRMFNDGKNLVTINLPKSVQTQKEKRLEEEKAKESTGTEIREMVRDTDENDDYTLSRKKRFFFDSFESARYEEPKTYEPVVTDYSIDVWNGSPGLEQWGYTPTENLECNTLRGAYDGTIFPQNISQTEVFQYYRKAFCRTLPIHFSHAGKQDGLDAYWFQLSENAFDNDNYDPQQSCFCDKGKCLKKGLGNITPCYYDIPVAVSLPHFYKSDPSLVAAIDGLSPSPEKHESEIVMQPRLGIPMKANCRVQMNLMVGETKFNADTEPFNNLVIPVMWVELKIDSLPDNILFLLKFLFNFAPYLQTGAIIVLAMIGMAFFAVTIISVCFIPKTSFEDYPKQDVKYSAINMLPYIRKGLEMYQLEKLDHEEISTIVDEL